MRKVYEMTEFQSFKVSKFQRVAPNSVSGLVFYIISFFFVLIFGLGIPDVILAQETSEDAALEDVLSGFDDEGAEEDDVLSGFDDGSTELLSGDVDADGERESGVDDESWSNLSGSTGLSLSYSYVKEKPADKTGADWSGLTKLRPYFSLTWDAKLGENWKTRIS
ncbi:MAG TPA: ligand-binding protein SH3, partial [Deltaproteobacteria bacterium]|nr:ligand-binding protein SH3 [Deltaproteobacteria bacterium]